MSEKITFQELVESIAEETDNSRQFTQDFIKDFVEVINDGLEEDGSVNIAGFGKFKLRRVAEREGYNPQTEEKITIPAHNKLVFKPYKNLRELVNAPYSHQEPELIKEDEQSNEDEDTIEEGASDTKEGDQSDFIPTGAPTSTQSGKEIDEDEKEEVIPFVFDDEEKEEKETEDDSDDPFAFDSSEESFDEEDDEDIVEFNAEQNTVEDDEIDKELDEFFGESEKAEKNDEEYQPSQESIEDDSPEQSEESPEKSAGVFDDLEEEQEDIDETENEEKESPPKLTLNQQRQTQSRGSAGVIMVAAAFILLLAAGGAWYFGLISDNNQAETESSEMVAASSEQTAESDQQAQSADNQDQDNQQTQQKDSDQNQSQNSGSSSSAATAANTQNQDNEEIQIEKGQTLWSLAEEKYGNPRLWPWIYGTNKSVENPDLIYAGNSLSVPLPSGPNNRLNDADSVGVAKGYLATYRWYKDNDSPKAKNHLLGAKLYHDDIRNIADVKIDKADLSYANRAR